MLRELANDSSVSLEVDLSKFDSKSNYRDIRNTIAHGSKNFENPSINLQEEVKSLIYDIDEILEQLSPFLIKYQKFI